MSKQRILFWDVAVGGKPPDMVKWLAIHKLLAKAFILNGDQPFSVGCLKSLDYCDEGCYYSQKFPPHVCDDCCEYYESNYRSVDGLVTTPFVDFITPPIRKKVTACMDELRTIGDLVQYEIGGVKLGEFALYGCQRFFRDVGILHNEALVPQVADYLKKSLKCGLVVYYATPDVLTKLNPDIIFMQNGKFMQEAVFRILAREKGYTVYVWEGSIKKGAVSFSNVADGGADYIYDEAYEAYYKSMKKLARKQAVALRKNMKSRQKGEGTYHSVVKHKWFGSGLCSDWTKTITMFPNVSWDSSLHGKHLAYENMNAWMTHIMDLFSNGRQYNLLVASHPQDDLLSTKVSCRKIVTDFLQRHPNASIQLVDKEWGYSNYEIMRKSKLCLFYSSNMALECAYWNVPAICFGRRHYTEAGIVKTVRERRETEDVLSTDDALSRYIHAHKYDRNKVGVYCYRLFNDTCVYPSMFGEAVKAFSESKTLHPDGVKMKGKNMRNDLC